MDNFIPDGYTLDREIPAEEHVHKAFSLTYRPIGPEDMAAYQALLSPESKQQNIAAAARLQTELLAQHIKSWSDARDITPAALRDMNRFLRTKVWEIVAGSRQEIAEWQARIKNSSGASAPS